MLFVREGRGASQNESQVTKGLSYRDEQGVAVLIAMIALSIFSVLGMYMSLNATTEVRIADNYESKLQADFAARAGMDHARELLMDLQVNDLLNGPDATHSNAVNYMNQARTAAFRNPLTWQTARSLDILNPANAVSGLPDDGIVNTGKYNTTNGTPLIPITGIALSSPNPYGPGSIITSRYFVKVTDNNGEASDQMRRDEANCPERFTGIQRRLLRTYRLALVHQTVLVRLAGINSAFAEMSPEQDESE